MKITHVSLKNFQSYKQLEFDFSDLGLALIAGQMKSGKSTVMDGPAWTLFGVTSKDSAADDVRSWFADGEVTEGVVRVEASNEVLIVTRRRGKSSAKNDFFFQVEGTEEEIRGKDARNDTQALLNERLGIDADLYIAASYLHQFSRADQFFLSKAKDRRETLERIADQSFAIRIGDQMSESRKSAKKARDSENETKLKLDGKIESTRALIADLARVSERWKDSHACRIDTITEAREDWAKKQTAQMVAMRLALQSFEKGRASRVAVAQERADVWEAKRSDRVGAAETVISSWHEKQEQKLKAIKASYDKWAQDQGARAMKIADQLVLLDKEIDDVKVFELQKAQAKKQIKAMEQVEADLKVKTAEKAALNHQIKTLQAEFGKLDSLDGVCPTCLGPADNEHSQARMEEITIEVAAALEQLDAVAEVVAQLETVVSTREKLHESFQAVCTRETQNKARIDRAQDLRAQVIVIKAETNPYAKQLTAARSEMNPHLSALEAVKAEANPHLSGISHAETEPNPHHVELAALEKQVNPFIASLKSLKAEKDPYEPQVDAQRKALERLEAESLKSSQTLGEIDHKITSLTWLYDKSFELRGQLLESAVRQIQDGTNEILERFFDAELRVKFSLPDSDKLEVEIWNEGYPCPFKQLSGGERTLLCRAFSFAYMKAAENTAGIKLDQLMLDEVLNGLDAPMKIKAFGLLQSMAEEYSTILLIDHHEEFKQLFPTQFLVTKAGAYSRVERVDAA